MRSECEARYPAASSLEDPDPSPSPAGAERKRIVHRDRGEVADLVFRGRKEVVVVDGQEHFRRLETRDGTEAWLLGSLIGEGPEALADPSRFADPFGRYLLLVHDPRAHTLTLHDDRHGAIPCYEARSADRLFFSLRLQLLVARGASPGRLDPASLAGLLAFDRPLGCGTLLAGVRTLDAATSTTIGLDDLGVRTSRRWEPERLLGSERLAIEDVQEELADRFLAGVEAAVGDAEHVAVTLSGGIDTRCLLAAALALGRPVAAYHVSVPGSRARQYARRIAEACNVPFEAHAIDAGFARRYPELLARVVDATEGMKLGPQTEMLWLRDQIPPESVVLHGAFGELSKLRVLRNLWIDETLIATPRRELAALLWRRFEPPLRSGLRIFSPELRHAIEPHARRDLEARLEAAPADLDAADAVQWLYLDDFPRSARYGHQLWNARVPTRFPFLHPAYVDLLLRVRNADRLEQRAQLHFLQRTNPLLYRMPDENTGTRADAHRLWSELVRIADKLRILLADSKVEAGHGDLLGWLQRMDPGPEHFVEEVRGLGLYDVESLLGLAREVREAGERSGPRRAWAARRARPAAQALQSFLVLELARRRLGWSAP